MALQFEEHKAGHSWSTTDAGVLNFADGAGRKPLG